MAAAHCSRHDRPTKRSPGHTPNIEPTLKFAGITDDPSSGSKATLYISCSTLSNGARTSYSIKLPSDYNELKMVTHEYPAPPSGTSVGVSSLDAYETALELLSAS